ncbi:MAG: dihydroneopterin aldolase [Alphaproteobacteria bacterium]|nr:dihydroneopterin aldolase [Alphaproteobacteria bacterium]
MQEKTVTGKNLVFLRDCRVSLNVGLYDHEQKGPQPLLISVEAELDSHERFDNIDEATTLRTLDYDNLFRFVTQELPSLGHIYLLESVAEKIADFCLTTPAALRVTVNVAKVSIYGNGAAPGVIIVRDK